MQSRLGSTSTNVTGNCRLMYCTVLYSSLLFRIEAAHVGRGHAYVSVT